VGEKWKIPTIELGAILWPTFKIWCLWSIWLSYHSSMIQKLYSIWKVGIWGWRKKKFNIWTSNEWSKLHIQFHLQTRPPQKKASSRACCWASQNPANFTFKTGDRFFLVATAVIAFLPPIGDTCKSHVNVHGHCDKIYRQFMATQVKFPRESLATEAAHSLRHALYRSQGPKHLGANFEHLGLFVGPNFLLINARTLTSGY
jgi:hypothetical protein